MIGCESDLEQTQRDTTLLTAFFSSGSERVAKKEDLSHSLSDGNILLHSFILVPLDI